MIKRVDSRHFLKELLFAQSEPVVIVDALVEWQIATRWSPHYLSEALKERSTEVTISRDSHFGCNPGLDTSTTPAFSRSEMDFAAASRAILANIAGPSCYVMQQSIPERFPELMHNLVIPEWVPDKGTISLNLWFGCGTRTPLHYDNANNYFAQVYGEKHFVIFSPHDSKYLYPFEIQTPTPHLSQVDVGAPDLRNHEQFANAAALEFTVSQGEVLFLPAFWWHYVRAKEVSISVSMWWPPRSDQIIASPNAVRGLYCAYDEDRLARFKKRCLEPDGLDLLGAARLLLLHDRTWGACILALAAFDEYVRNTGLYNERSPGCALRDLQADMVSVCGRIGTVRNLAPWQVDLLRALPDIAARAAHGNDTLFDVTEVGAVIDSLSRLDSESL